MEKRFWEIFKRRKRSRKKYCYGKQNDYFDNENIIGWTLEGDEKHSNSGLAVIMSDNIGGSKNMYIGKKFAGKEMYDVLGNVEEKIYVDENGNAEFKCNGGNISVWVKSKNA